MQETCMSEIIIGLGGVVFGGLFTIVGSYLSAKYKIKELEFLKIRTFTEKKLYAAHEKLDEIYIPIVSLIENLDQQYTIFYEEPSDDNNKNFKQTFKDLKNTYGEIKKGGKSIFLISEIQEELDYLIELIEKSLACGNGKLKLVMLVRIQALGLRTESKKIYGPFWGPIIYFFNNILGSISVPWFLKKWTGPLSIESKDLRVYSANINSETFKDAINLSISLIKSTSKEIALFKSN